MLLGAPNQRWLELCQLAGNEKDPDKRAAIVDEIARTLQRAEFHLDAESFGQLRILLKKKAS